MGYFGINHKIAQFLGLAHAQRLKPVTGLVAAQCYFAAYFIKVEAGAEVISLPDYLFPF